MKKENLSRIIVAGLIATSISVYTNVDNTTFASHCLGWGQQNVFEGLTNQNASQQEQLDKQKTDIENNANDIKGLQNQNASQQEQLDDQKADIEGWTDQSGGQQEELDKQ